jgi:hypothetical protein
LLFIKGISSKKTQLNQLLDSAAFGSEHQKAKLKPLSHVEISPFNP